MDKTEADLEQTAQRAAVEQHPALIVAYHPQREIIGAFTHVTRSVVLGRGHEAFGPGGLDDSLISRNHLNVTRQGAQVKVSDAGSQNGSLLNGQPLGVETELRPGDVVWIGRVGLVYQVVPAYHRRHAHPFLVGVGPATGRLLQRITQAATGMIPVLVQGEAGVGKELVARALHDQSKRAGNFVALNCGAVADGVLHSELFGHLRGAFSGASEPRSGLVKDAEGGTLLLDEIGDATPAFQVALLRLLEQAEYRPVGSDRVSKADIRVIAATHVPLDKAVSEGRFRHDLFTRISQRIIEVEPLRDRPEDVIAIAYHLLDTADPSGASGDRAISRTMAQQLVRHPWAGNVRQLRGVMAQAVSETTEGQSLVMVEPLVEPRAREPFDPHAQTLSMPVVTKRRPDAEQLRALFARHDGNMKAMAEELGVGRNTLYRWFSRAGLDPSEMRNEGAE